MSESTLDDPGVYCCQSMRHQLIGTCRGVSIHTTGTNQCPDQIIGYYGRFREYSLSPINLPQYSIRFCPFCGTKFPTSLREKWFDTVEKAGHKPQLFLSIKELATLPVEFQSDKWWKLRNL